MSDDSSEFHHDSVGDTVRYQHDRQYALHVLIAFSKDRFETILRVFKVNVRVLATLASRPDLGQRIKVLVSANELA